ncbi:MAG: hypothetical protein K6G83_12275 [Lachnospiraceae bacterium]|nr:hypothetical protein [Lachnospiraceae bacterium]
MKKGKLMALALVGAMVVGLMPGMSMWTQAAENSADYTLTIPATLTVAHSGWNSAGDISATGSLASEKKLTVTAGSDDDFALVSGDNKIAYKMADAAPAEGTAFADVTAKTSWDFTSLSSTAATQTVGIVVDDYSTKPAGAYQDIVTFTVKVDQVDD